MNMKSILKMAAIAVVAVAIAKKIPVVQDHV